MDIWSVILIVSAVLLIVVLPIHFAIQSYHEHEDKKQCK